MSEGISTLGVQLVASHNLSSGQDQISDLSAQLTTGKVSEDMTDYSSNEAQKLLNLTSRINVQEGFETIIDTITPRLETYDSSMTGIEDSISDAYSALLSATVYDETDNASFESAIKGYLSDMNYYLNQKVGERYIYAGIRYNQEPVTDVATMISYIPPSSTTTVASPAVPNYDTDYNNASPADPYPEAWIEDSAQIDTAKELEYGVCSTNDAFQEIILGLQWAYAATQDPTNYETYMAQGLDLISTGLSDVRAVHTDVTNSFATLTRTAEQIDTRINNLNDQIDNIEAVDVNEVSVKITTLQTQLEAAYAVTARVADLTLLDYI